MDLLLGLFFNSIWLIGSFLFGWLLSKLFAFVPLPGWLEMSIIMALSLWVGLMGMATFIGKSMGKSWAGCREEAKGLLLVGSPTGAACIVAVVCYLLINKFALDAELEKYIVVGLTLAFWFITMSVFITRLERQSKKERDDYDAQKKRL